jgi:hypothetical protein
MRISVAVCFVAVSGSLLAYAPGARAEEEEKYVLPVSYPERGITNPAGILSPVLDVDFTRIPGAGAALPAAGGGGGGAQIATGLAVGAGYAITNDFGVRATVLSLSLTPSPVYYTGVTGGATFRFLRGPFEMGIALDGGVQLPVPNTNGSAFGLIAPSIPMHIHIGKPARLDITPTFPIEAGAPGLAPGAGKSTFIGLSVPVQLAVDIIEPLHVGVTTGYSMILNPPTGVTVGDNVFIPVGFIAGYAIAGRKGPILDLDPFFLWPELFTPGTSGMGTSKVDSGNYMFGLEATVYLYL